MAYPVTLELNPEMQKRYQVFQRRVGAVAGRHKLYLEEEQSAITDCYTFELSNVKARIEINREVPMDLYEELHQCFKKSFG